MLELNNLNLKVDDLVLFTNLNLKINQGEIHVLMGRNGVGKSSIAKMLMGDPNYQVTGEIKYNGEVINNLNTYERALRGIYLINQAPIAIEGVTNAEMLRVALTSKTNEPIDIFAFNKELEKICQELDLDKSFIHREINVGCSGGERKKIELLHMWLLKPSLVILDEIDSGLDVDALKTVATSLKKYFNEYHPAFLIITHNDTLISHFSDCYVHLLGNQKILKSGKMDLAQEILQNGFKKNTNVSDTFVIRKN